MINLKKKKSNTSETKPPRSTMSFFGASTKWLLTGGVLVVALLFLLTPHEAQANWLADMAAGVVGKVMFVLSYVISWVAGIALAVLAWFIEIILRLNVDITNSPPVRIGFPISLSIANLGFVLAIIIIAIATILRLESYAMKQILWKLVVAALLVNFSLVFAGAILNLADQLTLYFIDQMSPDGVGGTHGFATKFAGAFNPQRLWQLTEQNLDPSKVQSYEKEVGASASFGESLGNVLVPIASVAFIGISMIVIVVTFIALLIMLLIRYVFIGILLIIMPLAWLAWIFPALSSNWGKWWKNFWKWTFFAPLVVLFLYIGMQTATQMSIPSSEPGAATESGAWAAVVSFFSNLLAPIVPVILQQFIIVGIMIGGLFAANALSITGAHAALGAAKGAAGGLGKWAGAKTGGALARFATTSPKQRPPLQTPTGSGPKAWFQRGVNMVRKGGRAMTSGTQKAANWTTRTVLPTEARAGIAKFGAESKKVTLGGAIFAGVGKESGLWGKKKVKTKYSKHEKEELKKEMIKNYGMPAHQFEEWFEETGFEEEHGGEHEEGGEHSEEHGEEHGGGEHAPKIQVVGSRASVREAAGHSGP